jgi:hypothetical protein
MMLKAAAELKYRCAIVPIRFGYPGGGAAGRWIAKS